MKLQLHPFRFTHLVVFSLCLTAVSLNGCQGGKKKGRIESITDASVIPSNTEKTNDSEELPKVNTDILNFDKDAHLNPVYFTYDSSVLDAEARLEVQTASKQFIATPNTLIQVAGHCDERGTQEYNLALGERRAQSVRNQLRKLGVSGDRIITISYGEEFPADARGSEAAWSKNRRCEFQMSDRL